MSSYDGASVNQILRTVKALGGGNGDVELSLLTHALVVASLSTEVDRAIVHAQIDKLCLGWLSRENLPLPPWRSRE